MEIEFVRSRFIKHFDGKTGNLYASPGRINLIGEHTDYNGGFVFPGAVDKGMLCEIRPNGTNTIMCYSIDLKDRVEFKVDDPQGPRASWARYIYGVVQEMRKLGVDVKGFNTAFAGDVHLGAATRCRNVVFCSTRELLCLRAQRPLRRQQSVEMGYGVGRTGH